MTSFSASHPRQEAATLPLAVGIIVALTILRIVGLHTTVVDLFFDEAQYWSWSRDLQLGYFSKPPLLAWIIAGASALCGDGEVCVRLPSPLMHCATSLVVFAIGQELYGHRTAFWSSLLCAFGTGTAFSARIISTDVPLLLCWALALLAYVKLLRAPRYHWALLLGAALGLGVLAKYAMLYFVLGVAAAAWLTHDGRAVLRQPPVWLALAVAAAIIAPHVWWNIAHDFVTIRHTSDLAIEGHKLNALRIFSFLGSQFFVFGPIVFGVLLYALARWRSLPNEDRLMIAFAAPPLAIMCGLSFFNQVNANWAAVSFVSAAVLAAAILVRHQARAWLIASIVIGLIAQGALLAADAHATELKLGTRSFSNPYIRTLGWRAYGEGAGQMARRVGAPTIAADTRSDVSALLYYWRDQPEQIRAWRTTGSLRFDLSASLSDPAREPILFVTECPLVDRIAPFFDKIEPVGYFDVTTGATTIRRYFGFLVQSARRPIETLRRCVTADPSSSR